MAAAHMAAAIIRFVMIGVVYITVLILWCGSQR